MGLKDKCSNDNLQNEINYPMATNVSDQKQNEGKCEVE